MTEEIVLTKADRLDEPTPEPINPEVMFRRIIITPMNIFDNKESINEHFNNNESRKTKFDKKPRVVIFSSPSFQHSKQKQYISSQLDNIERQNESLVKNDELQDVMFKYFSLIICLIILISMTSIVFIKFLGVKQKYDLMGQISD